MCVLFSRPLSLHWSRLQDIRNPDSYIGELVHSPFFPTSAHHSHNTSKMTSPLTNVLLIGAGGNVGPTILNAFSTDPHFTVSILTRKSSKSTFPSNLTVHRVDDSYPEAELLEAFKGQDAIVSTITTANAQKQKDIIDVAVKAGVKRFVPSEFGSDTGNEKAMGLLPQYFREKRETVEYLKGKEGEGMTWSAFVTGPFFEL